MRPETNPQGVKSDLRGRLPAQEKPPFQIQMTATTSTFMSQNTCHIKFTIRDIFHNTMQLSPLLTCRSPERSLVPISSPSPFFSPPQPLPTTNLLSVSMNWSVLSFHISGTM